jgi:hypothetical protein
MLRWYRSLIEARRTHAALRDDRADSTRVHRSGSVIAIERGPLTLACNVGDEAAPRDLGDVVLASRDLANGRELPPRSCVLYRTRT